MENAYIDEEKGQAICCWNAPDKEAVKDLFQKAGVEPESIDAAKLYKPAG